MKNKYGYGSYIDLNDYKTVTYGKYDDYEDLIDQLGTYYNTVRFTEESEEQKTIRLAKEKAEKRNNKIDQLLGE
jgi:hypothetical protein